MKLLRVEIEDFRCFGKVEFDFTDPTKNGDPSNIALLVGKNGSGKSSLLQAIAGYFDNFQLEYDGDPLRLSDVREGQPQASIKATWRDTFKKEAMFESKDELGTFSIPVYLCRERSVGLRLEPGIHRVDSNLYSGNLTDWGWWRETARQRKDLSTGLIAFFDVYRLLPPIQVEGPNLRGVPKHRTERSLASTIRRDGRIDPRFSQLKQWIVNIDFLRAKAKADFGKDSPLWETLRNALNTILAPYTFERVDERFEVLFRTPTGVVPLEALSDGFRSIFVIITDLLLRLSLSTSDPEKILEQEAVCLIDEIDAHLHPAWQLKVIPGLTTLFPNVQFIATTHSALVVSTVAPHQIFMLEDEETL